MDLQEVKKEVRELPSMEQAVSRFQEHWIKAIRTNGNYRCSFLQRLDRKTERELKRKLAHSQELCKEIRSAQHIHDKLSHYSRSLVELKLASFRRDEAKAKMLTRQLLQDEYLRFSTTIAAIQKNEHKLRELEKQYRDVNALLEKNLSLEETLFLMELPHYKYLQNLLNITEKQKKIVRELGHHFLTLARERER